MYYSFMLQNDSGIIFERFENPGVHEFFAFQAQGPGEAGPRVGG